jgi:DNA (cytosine-5)-methyltransferase 1
MPGVIGTSIHREPVFIPEKLLGLFERTNWQVACPTKRRGARPEPRPTHRYRCSHAQDVALMYCWKFQNQKKISRVSTEDLLTNPHRVGAPENVRHCSLFTGIGGFDVGLGRAGIETVMVCDNDPTARAVLKKHFGDIRYRKSVDRLGALPTCDLLTAGWPCQDLSQAGKTAGITGSRSNLIKHVFATLESTRRKPQYILLENVAFALHLDGGNAVRTVVRSLEALGYQWAYRILNTREFGLAQRRRRIFIAAALDFDPAALLYDGASVDLEESASRHTGFYWTEGNRGIGWTRDGIPPLKGGSSLSIPSPPAVWDRDTHEFFSPGIRDAERLQGFKAGWTSPAVEEFGDRVRWRLVGNAVSVPIANWLGKRILAMNAGTLRQVDLPKRESSKRHNMAWGGPNKKAMYVFVDREGPAKPKRASLADFRFLDAAPLSTRAASGFLSRVVESPLSVEHAFLVDLGRYSGRRDLIPRKAA